MKHISLLQKHGLRLTHIARKMGMGESLLRYHLSQKEIDPSVEKKFVATVAKTVADLQKGLKACAA